jgi:hypothetical protein
MRKWIQNIILQTLIDYRKLIKEENREPVFDLKEQVLELTNSINEFENAFHGLYTGIYEKLEKLDIEKILREEIKSKLTEYFQEDYNKHVKDTQKKASKTIKDKIDNRRKKKNSNR